MALSAGARGMPAPFYLLLQLPTGMTRGFVTVTLAYLLTQAGVGVGAVGALVALYVAPEAWKFFFGPMLDMSLSPRVWYGLSLAVGALALALFALIPLEPGNMALITAVALTVSIAINLMGSSFTTLVAATVPDDRRGSVAGWGQSGNLGGAGLGGGLGLWLATHAGGQVTASLGVAALCLACATPVLLLRAPRTTGATAFGARLRELWGALMELLRTRNGVLALIAVTIPVALGASSGLLAAVSGDWHASADVVALTLGAVGGLATLPGCVLGGYLCDRYPKRIVYVGSALASSLGLAAMAVGPHTSFAFGAFVLANAFLLGVAWAAVAAVIYEQLDGRAAATVGAVLASFCNLPVVVVTAVVAGVAERHGSTAMLLTEAALGVASALAYALLAWLWRPGTRVALAAA